MYKLLILIATIGLGILGAKLLIGDTLDYKNVEQTEIKEIEKQSKADSIKNKLAKKIKEKNEEKELERWKKENKEKIVKTKDTFNEIEIKAITQEEIKAESTKIKNKILLRRDKYAQKGLIQEGNTYLENKQLILALRSFRKALKISPGNAIILKKMGDTYFEMNNYKLAYSYYKNLIGMPENNSDRTILSYIYSLNFLDNLNVSNIFREIDKNKLNKDDSFFYKTSIECAIDRNDCLKKFEKYIKEGKGRNNFKIDLIKKGFKNFKDLQIKSEYFKHTQLMAALFQVKVYPISNLLGHKILKKQKGYLPVLKMIAKGFYEMGKFKDAKKYLIKYNEINNNDINVNYLLGIINIKLHEYVLSNVFFNRALKLGYRPKANISRRLIYNFYLVEDNKKMMSEFKELIEKTNNINETDYSLGIYYSLINGKNIQANSWINKALKLYPKNDDFYGYKGWVYKEAQEYEKAERYLLKGFEINKHNPLINLNLGIIHMKKNNLLKAKIYFKNTIKENSKGDFGKSASEYLAKIKLEQEKEKKLIEAKMKLAEEGESSLNQ